MTFNIEIVSLIAGAVFGAPLGYWFSSYSQRPKLSMQGAGSGSDARGAYVTIRIGNMPAFTGVQIGETTLFGKRLWSDSAWGWHSDRQPARDCVAHLEHVGSGELFPLYYQTGKAESPWANLITLHSGETVDLVVIARGPAADREYYPFAPDWSDPQKISGAPAGVRFTGPERFRLIIRYGPNGAGRFEKKLMMSHGHTSLTHRWGWNRKHGGSTF